MPVINLSLMKRPYDATRRRQAKLHGRELTPHAQAAGDVVFSTACEAADDVKHGRADVAMRSVSLATGVGKSTAAYAFIATMARVDRTFTTAYVVPTIKLAIEVQRGIEELLGPNTTTLWSSFHKLHGVDERGCGSFAQIRKALPRTRARRVRTAGS
jgi:hypothetical protein